MKRFAEGAAAPIMGAMMIVVSPRHEMGDFIATKSQPILESAPTNLARG